jgi:hypothetical protein
MPAHRPFIDAHRSRIDSVPIVYRWAIDPVWVVIDPASMAIDPVLVVIDPASMFRRACSCTTRPAGR